MAGFDDLSSRASAAGSMKRGGGPMSGDDLAPQDPAADDQGQQPDSQADVAMQAALDAIDQGADVYGDQVAQEIRSHTNAIRELVSQGETGQDEDAPPPDDSNASPDAGSSTQGMESQTPSTQASDMGGGFPQ